MGLEWQKNAAELVAEIEKMCVERKINQIEETIACFTILTILVKNGIPMRTMKAMFQTMVKESP